MSVENPEEKDNLKELPGEEKEPVSGEEETPEEDTQSTQEAGEDTDQTPEEEKDAFEEFVEGKAEEKEEIKEVPHIVLGKEIEKEEVVIEKEPTVKSTIYTLRTTANREEQVMDFVTSNAIKKGLDIFSVVHPHGMRGYIFIEAASRRDAEEAAFRVPYARGILPHTIQYKDIEHMLEKSKKVEMDIRKNDIAEIITGPFKREKCRITRIDRAKDEVVVELLESAVPIPITLKIDAIKVIRRDTEEGKETE